ncbi:uracil-DNA glycosylase [Thioclava sp. GXIMD2076]|uniref:uracil-DNA glycosylase n=1 Tax=Thioclava sp. GXIMD2076 TaxID=3131931 RepID=UPI0030D4AFC7
MSAGDILKALERLEFDNTFNPYFERCPVYDAQEAPEIRRFYLHAMLERAAAADLDAIWVGRDLGYRGGRRTGLALTDDVHFSSHLSRWGLKPERPTYGEPVSERTASVIWNILLQVQAPIFLWNVFPLHPFEGSKPFTNRAHNAQERRAGTDILVQIVDYLKPKRIVAIGNDAFNVVSSAVSCRDVSKVRHPSYGGQKEFLSTMRRLYSDVMEDLEPDLFSMSHVAVDH